MKSEYISSSSKAPQFDNQYNSTCSLRDFDFFSTSTNSIIVPQKAIKEVEHLSKKLLMKISPEPKVAQEYCLYFISLIVKQKFNAVYVDPWVSLKAKYLQENFSGSNRYKSVEIVLEKGTRNGSIIEIDHSYYPGAWTKKIKLTTRFLKKNLTNYRLKTDEVAIAVSRQYTRTLDACRDNIIGTNLLQFYSHLSYPSIHKINEQANYLVSNKIQKGGRTYIFKGNSSSVDRKKYRIIEDDIERFKLAIERWLEIPKVGSENAGHRVYDSLNMLPSWIRNLFKYKGRTLIELDFSCLHPNIASSMFGGTGKTISHDQVASYLKISRKKAKNANLSFFNLPIKSGLYNGKRLPAMQYSPLYKYYKDNEPLMLKNIEEDKRINGYKSTSKKMLKKEVELMSNIIQLLNDKQIYVGYVFDALMCLPEDEALVRSIMNSCAQNLAINTKASSE